MMIKHGIWGSPMFFFLKASQSHAILAHKTGQVFLLKKTLSQEQKRLNTNFNNKLLLYKKGSTLGVQHMVNVYCLMPSFLTDIHVRNTVKNEILGLFVSENRVPQISRLIIIFPINMAMLPFPYFKTLDKPIWENTCYILLSHCSPWNSWNSALVLGPVWLRN